MRRQSRTDRFIPADSAEAAVAGSPCFDHLQFFRSWLADPFRVAAVAPSGPSLSRLITREIGPREGPVLELGPGTGVFTKALLARGVQEHDLTLIENSADFVKVLQQRFPRARVLAMDATRLCGAELFPAGAAGAAVSGLPLLSMTPRMVMSILAGVFGCLRPQGALYQFTYGPRCPVPRPILERLGLEAERTGWTALNLPPAAVYRLVRRPS